MNVAHVRQWVAALRSGEYPQGRDGLRTEDGYCCLGVVCELAGMEAVYHGDGRYAYDRCTGMLPRRAMEWLGIDTASPRIGSKTAITLNDDYLLSFPQIADLIEEHWLGVAP